DAEGSTRWIAEVADGFGHTPEHEDRSDAGGEEHREPGTVRMFGRFVVGPELRSTVPRGREVDEEAEEDSDAEDVEPAEVRQQPVRGHGDRRVESVGEEDRPEDEDDDHGGGGEEDGRVRSEPEGIVQSVEHERYLPLTVSTRLHFCDPNYS